MFIDRDPLKIRSSFLFCAYMQYFIFRNNYEIKNILPIITFVKRLYFQVGKIKPKCCFMKSIHYVLNLQ